MGTGTPTTTVVLCLRQPVDRIIDEGGQVLLGRDDVRHAHGGGISRGGICTGGPTGGVCDRGFAVRGRFEQHRDAPHQECEHQCRQ